MTTRGSDHQRSITRRRALKRIATAGAGAIALSLPTIRRRAHGAQTLVVADPGGAYTPAFTEAYYKPFSKEFGVEVVGIVRPAAPAAQIKAMVEAKSYKWDVVDLAESEVILLQKAGLLEPIDTSGADYAEIPADMKTPYWSGTDVYSMTMTYSTAKFGAKGLRNWIDMWDVKAFPGRRSLRRRGYETPEIVMCAAGVPPGPEIYKALAAPGGWDRMFRKLDEIRPHINVWWDTNAQSTQLIKTGEVDICPATNSRAQIAIDAGAPFVIVWDMAFYTPSGLVIPRGNPKADLARKFVAFTANARRQAAMAPYTTNGPANPNAYKYIDPKRARVMPTAPDNIKRQFRMDAGFWSQNKAKSEERMAEWILKA